MTAKINKQIEGAKKRTSVAPAAKEIKRKSGSKTRGVAAAKAAKVRSLPGSKRVAAGERPENEAPRAETNSHAEGQPQEIGAGAAEAIQATETSEGTPETGDESTGKSCGAKSTNGGASAVKPLTEAGKKRLVNKLLGLAETQATQGGFKITPADLIRLMQLHKEMTPQRDRKVTVQWVEDKPE